MIDFLWDHYESINEMARMIEIDYFNLHKYINKVKNTPNKDPDDVISQKDYTEIDQKLHQEWSKLLKKQKEIDVAWKEIKEHSTFKTVHEIKNEEYPQF